MDELALKEREEAKEAKLRNSEMFKSVLEEDNVKHNTRWDDVRGTYK